MLIVLILQVALFSSCSKKDIPENCKYLSQIPPGKVAKLFAPQIIKHLAHSSPTFTPDDKEIYWSTVSEKEETRKIYFVKYENKNWSKPRMVSFSGTYHDDQPFISDDGKKLYFASKRPKTANGKQENDIWISIKNEHGWGEPTPINKLIGFWTYTS